MVHCAMRGPNAPGHAGWLKQRSDPTWNQRSSCTAGPNPHQLQGHTRRRMLGFGFASAQPTNLWIAYRFWFWNEVMKTGWGQRIRDRNSLRVL